MPCLSSCCRPFWRHCDRSAVGALWVEVPRVARGLVALAPATHGYSLRPLRGRKAPSAMFRNSAGWSRYRSSRPSQVSSLQRSTEQQTCDESAASYWRNLRSSGSWLLNEHAMIARSAPSCSTFLSSTSFTRVIGTRPGVASTDSSMAPSSATSSGSLEK